MNLKKTATYFLIAGSLFGSNHYAAAQGLSGKDSTSTEEVAQTVTTMKPGESNFMIVGLTTFGFVRSAVTATGAGTVKSNSLGDAERYEFSPMMLWRHGDKLLAEFEPSFDGSAIGVNWADVSYFVAPGLIAKCGYFVLPFGTYSKRLAAGWINKLTSDPLGMNVAGSDFGVEVAGGLPLGNMKWSYDVSLTNGFQLNNDGTIANGMLATGNNGKTVCGRVSLLPFSNSSMEIGVSGLYGSLATPQGANFTNTDPTSTKGPNVSMFAVDFNFVHNVNPIQINIKAQYSATMVSAMNYLDTATQSNFTFTNTISDLFGQVSLRPSKSNNKIIKNLEVAFRYVNYQAPKQSQWGQNYNEMDFALDYWLSWRTVLKAGYEVRKADGTSFDNSQGLINNSTTNTNNLIIQFSTEF